MKFERLRFPTVAFQSAVCESEFPIFDSLTITCLSPVIHQFIQLFRFIKLWQLSAFTILAVFQNTLFLAFFSPKVLET